MKAPAWFVRELELLSDRLLIRWERYRSRELVIPLEGDAWTRIETGDVVEYSYYGEGPDGPRTGVQFMHTYDPAKPSIKIEDDFGNAHHVNPGVFDGGGPNVKRPDRQDITDGRFVIFEKAQGRPHKVCDFVDARGRLHAFDSEALRWIAARKEGYARAEEETEALAEAERQAASQSFREGMHDAFEAMYHVGTDRQQVGYEPERPAVVTQRDGFTVTDRRRGAVEGGTTA